MAGELRRLARFLPNTKILTCAVVNRSVCSVIRCNMRRIYRGNAGPFAGSPAKRHGITGALNTLVMDEADRMLDMGFSEPLMMSSVLRQHLGRRFCFRHLAGSHRRNQRKSAARSFSDEIDSTDALPPIEQQFYETSRKAKFLCCNGY